MIIRRTTVALLVIGILTLLLAGSVARADRQCWEPYVVVSGHRYVVKTCIPCVGGLCAALPPPPSRVSGSAGIASTSASR